MIYIKLHFLFAAISIITMLLAKMDKRLPIQVILFVSILLPEVILFMYIRQWVETLRDFITDEYYAYKATKLLKKIKKSLSEKGVEIDFDKLLNKKTN